MPADEEGDGEGDGVATGGTTPAGTGQTPTAASPAAPPAAATAPAARVTAAAGRVRTNGGGAPSPEAAAEVWELGPGTQRDMGEPTWTTADDMPLWWWRGEAPGSVAAGLAPASPLAVAQAVLPGGTVEREAAFLLLVGAGGGAVLLGAAARRRPARARARARR